jgi:hypothetical protein
MEPRRHKKNNRPCPRSLFERIIEVLNVKQLPAFFARHQLKVWGAALVILAVLVLNTAAGPRLAPGQWEYRTLVFKVEQGEPVAKLQAEFEATLNREAADGWEFVAPCARLSNDLYGIDYLVLRRRVR